MPAHFMRYILHLSAARKIEAEKVSDVVLRTGLGFKTDAVLYKTMDGELSVRTSGEFERMFNGPKAEH